VDKPPVLDAVLDDLAQRVAPCVLAGMPQTPAPEDDWLDARQAVAYSSSPLFAVYEAAEKGQLQVARRGRALRFRRSWIDAWLEGR
jgi:hypothetical protein